MYVSRHSVCVCFFPYGGNKNQVCTKKFTWHFAGFLYGRGNFWPTTYEMPSRTLSGNMGVESKRNGILHGSRWRGRRGLGATLPSTSSSRICSRAAIPMYIWTISTFQNYCKNISNHIYCCFWILIFILQEGIGGNQKVQSEMSMIESSVLPSMDGEVARTVFEPSLVLTL